MFAPTKNQQEPQYPDVMVIVSEDGTAEIVPVVEKSEDRLLCGADRGYSIPAGDAKSFTGKRGRIYLYPSTYENIADTQRLAALEKSIVLRQITQFTKPDQLPEKSIDTVKIMLFVVIIILIIFVGVK